MPTNSGNSLLQKPLTPNQQFNQSASSAVNAVVNAVNQNTASKPLGLNSMPLIQSVNPFMPQTTSNPLAQGSLNMQQGNLLQNQFQNPQLYPMSNPASSYPSSLPTPQPVQSLTKSVNLNGTSTPTVSLVDLLSSQGKDTSLASRGQLAMDNGLVKSVDEYRTLASQGLNGDINTKLAGILSGKGGSSLDTMKSQLLGAQSSLASMGAPAKSGFSIDTSNVGTNHLGNTGISTGDILNKNKENAQKALDQTNTAYQQAVKDLRSAQQYSPEYIDAQMRIHEITLKRDALQQSIFSGKNPDGSKLEGATIGFANRLIASQTADLQREEGNAQLALTRAEMQRTSNIAGAKTVVDAYAPQSVSAGTSLISPYDGGVIYGGAGAYTNMQAQQTYFNLQQQFPDAGMPPYNPDLTPQQNLQIAQTRASMSPSFQSRNLMQVTDSAGGIHFVNKNQLQTNSDGSYTYIGSAEGAGLKSDSASLTDQQKYYDDVNRAITSADNAFKQVITIAKNKGLNTGVPLANALANKTKYNLGDADVVAFEAGLTEVQNEYNQVFSRGGAVTDTVRNLSSGLFNNSLSIAQLQQMHDELKSIAGITLQSTQDNINQIKTRLGGGGATGTSGTSGSIYDF